MQAWHVIFLISGFFDSLFLETVEAKSKTIGSLVPRPFSYAHAQEGKEGSGK